MDQPCHPNLDLTKSFADSTQVHEVTAVIRILPNARLERIEAPVAGCSRLVVRYNIPIVDLKTGEKKILNASRSLTDKIFRLMSEKVQPRSSWLRRLLQWLHLVQPLVDPLDIEVIRKMDRWPSYHVHPVLFPKSKRPWYIQLLRL